MITEFGLHNFKGHSNTRLALGRFTLLAGDNASGKTSVLEALALQSRIVTDPEFREKVISRVELPRRGSVGPVFLTTQPQSRTPDPSNQMAPIPVPVREFKLLLKIGPGAALSLGEERRPKVTLDGLLHGESRYAAVDWSLFSEQVGTSTLYRLRAEAIAAPAYSKNPHVSVEHDGTNTAVALAAMKLGDDATFQRIEDGLRQIVPSVERIRIQRANVQHAVSTELGRKLADVVGFKVRFDFTGASDVPGEGASHGTLIALALLTILHSPNRPKMILLDDFDHTLHPRAQMELVRLIKSLLALDEFKDVQIVATTHSPYVLDELDPADVYAFALRDDGTIASKRLSEHPEAERTRGSLKAGQLWSLDPERDWVLQK